MEQKKEEKKRIRATWRMVHELERQRDDLQERLNDEVAISKHQSGLVEQLTAENSALRQSNALMEQELNLCRSRIGVLEEIADNRAVEVERLKSRGFFDRLFNR